MVKNFHTVIIGAGILGTSISFFLKHLNPSKKIAVIEQAPKVAFHTSGRNTGKIHAPYLYNPEKKRLFARAAFHGFDMWETYAKIHDLPFKKDGVIEVSFDEKGTAILEKLIFPSGIFPSPCKTDNFAKTASLCLLHVTPSIYSPSEETTEITNSGGFTHVVPFSLTEHLSGSIIGIILLIGY